MKFKKSLGQNLLIDKNILNKIISLTSLKNKNIIEIGPGTGNLTSFLLNAKPQKLICIEKDKKFFLDLKKTFKDQSKVIIINDDILKINIKDLLVKNTIIIGNLPYNISSQILVKFIRVKPWPPNFDRLIFMFQKEVGEKIIANYGSSNYSRLSILTKYRLKVLNYFYVSKNSFIPRPKVDSIVIEFTPVIRKNNILKEISILENITNTFFSNKRKMINKTFKKLKINDEKFFKSLDIDMSKRPENLSEETYFKIAEYFENMKIR